ncbi:YadA-like family protein [Acinetobacter sp. 5862]|uniref:YadA-like family protein n=1 Tax=Acinetobacter sp. 5862 TaxID=2967169 RepID=UPI002111EBEF|nr:YadA C-terminal domain-containing protein [Acinetobacter sp. 5862]
MKKSFQLSAVAIAIAASSSVMADQINVLSFDDVYGWTPTTSFNTDAFNTVTAAQSVTTPLVDLGSNITGQYTPNSSNPTNMPVQQLQAGDGTYYYEIQDGLGNNATNNASLPSAYTVVGGVLTPYVNNTGSSTFIYGGTAADLTKGTFDITQSVKKLSEDNLTYSDAVTKYDSIQTDLAVTDAQGNATTFNNATVQSGDYTEQSDAVVTGTFTKNGNKVYGLNATTKQGSYKADGSLKSGWDKETLLTSDGLVVTAKSKDVDGTERNDTTKVQGVGISTTGTLNVGGDTTLNTATVSGLLNANGGANVRGGLTADTATVTGALTAGASTLDSLTVTNAATVNGLFSANAGANVRGGLTTDTATITGLLNANGGANVRGGLTADTATITGLLSTDNILNNTLASNRIQAPVIVFANRDVLSAADGSIVKQNDFTSNGTSGNQLIGKYNVSGNDIYQLHVFENGVATEKFYVSNAGQLVEYTGDVSGIKNGTVAPVAGGTSRITSGTLTTGTVKNVATDKNITYSEQVTTQDATNIDATFDRGHPALNTAVGTGIPKSVEQSVVNGIIATNNGENIYGVEVSKTDANGTAKTTVTAGAVKTGTVTADTIIVGGTNVKDTLDAHTTAIAGLDTRVTANETAITNLDNRVTTEVGRLDGRVDAVDARVTANETAITTLDGRVTTEVNRLDGRIDTVAADTLATANTYTDTKVGAEKTAREAADTQIRTDFAAADVATLTSANGYTDTKAAATLTSANGYTDTKAAATLASANGYTDTKSAATLTSANTYTDTKAAATLVSANAYTDGRANQLNTRIDDVQKTAYRGIAIALAAQQAVPNIAPGQVAVFGGVGHYEGETAGSIGVVTSFTDRISASGAFGFAGGNEFGGRVGVAYVFGGK